MNPRRVPRAVPIARPFTDPLVSVTTLRYRRNSGKGNALREATIWAFPPDILVPERTRGRSLR
jgi:hypothetical protein